MIRKERYIMEITTSHRSRERTIQIFFYTKGKTIMSIQIKYSENYSYIELKHIESVRKSELDDAFSVVILFMNKSGIDKLLVDCNTMKSKTYISDIAELISHLKDIKCFPSIKSALVLSLNQIDAENVKFYEAAGINGFNIKLFNDRKNAVLWLKE